MKNCWIGAAEALRFGLVNSVTSSGKVFETADEMTKKIASFHPTAVRNAKQAVIKGLDLSLSEGLELERRLALGLRGDRRE